MVRELHTTGGGIKSCEQLVGAENLRPGQRIHQRRLSSIRVAHERNDRHAGRAALPSVVRALLANAFDFATQLRDPPADSPAVAFQLRLAGAPRIDTGPKSRQLNPAPCEPG